MHASVRVCGQAQIVYGRYVATIVDVCRRHAALCISCMYLWAAHLWLWVYLCLDDRATKSCDGQAEKLHRGGRLSYFGLSACSALSKATVVIVDEVHERCTEVDLLLLVLSKALALYKFNVGNSYTVKREGSY